MPKPFPGLLNRSRRSRHNNLVHTPVCLAFVKASGQEDHRIESITRIRHPELMPLLCVEFPKFTSDICHGAALISAIFRSEALFEFRKEAMDGAWRRPDRGGPVHDRTDIGIVGAR